MTALLISVSECPTVEQLMAETENLSESETVPVRFEGLNAPATDEWLFVSEIKGRDLAFTKIGSLRLVASPNDHLLLGPIAGKMNRTPMSTDLDIETVAKLVVRVRCVLRNVQSPRRGFSY